MDATLADTSSSLHIGAGDQTSKSDVSGGDQGDLTSNLQQNVDARMWIPRLLLLQSPNTHDDSLRETPAIGGELKVVDLPKDKPQVQKDGDAF